MTTFTDLVRSGVSASEIASHLDGLSPERRVEEVLAFPGGLQAKLWKIVEGSPAKLDGYVDTDEETIIYELKNNLPVFNVSQKRFYRRPGAEVVGYNHTTGLAAQFAGPGYFFAHDGAEMLEFDYTRLPSFRPDGWPEIKPNTGLIPGITYGNMIDYCRKVSQKTLIGAAYKGGKPRDAYFLLTRAASQS